MLIVSSVKAVIRKSCSEETLLTHVNRIFEIITRILQSAAGESCTSSRLPVILQEPHMCDLYRQDHLGMSETNRQNQGLMREQPHLP